MRLTESFTARGHPNIRARHGMTLMITKDAEVTKRGDCIAAVSSEKGLQEMDEGVKKAMRSEKAKIKLTLDAGGCKFEVSGRGDPRLPLSHPTDMVARKSGFISDRTFMLKADKAALDIPPQMVKLLQNPEQIIKLTLTVEDED